VGRVPQKKKTKNKLKNCLQALCWVTPSQECVPEITTLGSHLGGGYFGNSPLLGVTLHVHIPPRREEAFYAYSLRVEGILGLQEASYF